MSAAEDIARAAAEQAAKRLDADKVRAMVAELRRLNPWLEPEAVREAVCGYLTSRLGFHPAVVGPVRGLVEAVYDRVMGPLASPAPPSGAAGGAPGAVVDGELVDE